MNNTETRKLLSLHIDIATAELVTKCGLPQTSAG